MPTYRVGQTDQLERARALAWTATSSAALLEPPLDSSRATVKVSFSLFNTVAVRSYIAG